MRGGPAARCASWRPILQAGAGTFVAFAAIGALAAASKTPLMLATGTVHPPAGSNPAIVFLGHASWPFLLFPVGAGALLLVPIGLVWWRLVMRQPWPKRLTTPVKTAPATPPAPRAGG